MLDAKTAVRYDPCMRSLLKTLIACTVACACLPAAEQTYCAFEVKVTSASGSPRAGLPVVLVRNRQATFAEVRTDAKGIARICDTPIESVDIAVGFDVCGLVMIRNLHPKWPDMIRLFVTFEENPCAHFDLPEFCQVLLRVQDPRGGPMPGVRFVPKDGKNGTGTNVADTFGRIYRVVKRNSKLEGKLEGPSAKPVPVSLLIEDDKELTLVLGK